MRIECKVYVVVFIIIQLLYTGNLQATDHPPISYLGIERGLSNNSVRSIYQDHNGFMWFGTYDGLNRFDGYEFKVFRNKLGDTSSLPHNYIYTISEDTQNNLWIGTGQGIGIYNQLTSRFKPAYFLPYGSRKEEKITWSVNSIKTDTKGNVLIGTDGRGLIIRYKNSDIAVQIPCNYIQGKSYYSVQSIKIDKKQRTWLFIRDVGLCLLDNSSHQMRLVNNSLVTSNCMESDDQDNLWIGTANGVYKYSIASNSLVKLYNEESKKLTSDMIASLYYDQQHKLWIGTEGGGVNILNTKTEEINYLLLGANKNESSRESVFTIYEDRESRKWMGTLNDGIIKIEAHNNKFQTIAHDPLNTNSLVNNFVYSFYEDADKNLWIGTDGGGFSIWNRKQNRFDNFKYEPGNPYSLSNNLVSCIRKDYLNDIWIATYGGGINKFNKATGTFKHYKCINDVTGTENKVAKLIYEDRDKDLWVTTFRQGKLYRFNREQDRFEVFDQQLNDLVSLTEDRYGTMWAGNPSQLIKIDKHGKKLTYFDLGKPVRAIFEDRGGNFWVGTEGGGLILFDRQQGKISVRYSDANGLSNNAVLSILEDNKGYLWLSTFNGLSQFDPVRKTFKNYFQDDGLQSNQFVYNAAYRLQSGEFVFGGIKGFNIFYPDSITTRQGTPTVKITGLRINNLPTALESRYVTKVRGDQMETLTIPFHEAVLSIDFAALEYTAPRKISYAYYLEGWDKDWNYSGRLRTANYTHLSEGTYLLRIKSTNADGIWNPQEVKLQIIVLPPWYRSWWAYVIYLILAGVAIYKYLQYRTRQAKLAFEMSLAKLNAEKTQAQYLKEKAERETERIIIERDKEINAKRLSFFTNISHEFRTPLTLIINPLKDIIDKNVQGKTADINELNIVYRNARRLHSLVDQLLLFRKADEGADQLKISRLNFCSLCNEVYLAFVHQAKALNIKYEFDCPYETLEVYGDREKLEIILYNLISNALKYTPHGGKVVLKITEGDSTIDVAVSDNGYGIPKETGDKLFERFYQVQQKGVPSKSGFGIGLYLVKNFIDHHKGKICYYSEQGEGTTFYIQLQKGKEHLRELPIHEETIHNTAFLKELVEGGETLKENNTSNERKTEFEPLINENKSLLVADDDEQISQYIAKVFNDFTVYQARNGEEAFRLASQHIPDIIISDVNMDGMNGIDLCRTIKEDPSLSHIPVILLTGSSSSEIKLMGVEGGADDYITKPFEKELLLARVANLLKSKNNLQKYFYNEVTLQKNTLKISVEYKEFLERCIAIVEHNIDNNNFNIKILATELGMSHSNLYKKVKSISGQSVNAFIRFIRLRKAAEILINTNHNVNETAAEVGFNDLKYFREQFSKLFGMNPSEYIKKYRKVFGKSYTLNEDGHKMEN
ncbi:response regulator [Chitinophagaceae bacterium LB-8]|uniref:histidine kinase n=1 Tax=Paraflavisolibacter caeni TaxID=2982496 RepID=A0A9X2XZ36_9BACT|nr:two-component regulator propeller domain-containing protein [Paraflavisolibacter caeni]MCU7550188.1 response regulator [Paraflavisolibacter caeni]